MSYGRKTLRFLIEEGFIVEKEFDVGKVTLRWMRLAFNGI
jgi:hypothetical protein